MTSSRFLNQIGINVDRLVTTDFPSYGVIGPLSAGAADAQGGPLSMRAAELLKEAITPGSTAILLTGFIIPGHYPHGDTDGPLGTAVLARALSLGFSARILVATEPELTGLMESLLRAAGLEVMALDELSKVRQTSGPAAAVVGLSTNHAQASQQAAGWIRELDVKAVVAIEKSGANSAGVYHMVGGTDISDRTSKGAAVFSVAGEQKVLRIGVGDRGNELGMGPIAEIARSLLPRGRDCGCPCHGGVVDQTPAELSLPAVISNWGAYGIATCIAAIETRPELLHTAVLERELLETAIHNGGIDGMSGTARLAVDGIGLEAGVAITELLAEIYRAQSVRDPSPFSTPLIRNDHSQRGASPQMEESHDHS